MRCKILALSICGILLSVLPALPQGLQCRTANPGSVSPNCASEAFVTKSVAGSVAGVASIDGQTGAFTCGTGIDCSGGNIAVTPAVQVLPPMNYLAGLVISNDSVTPNSVIDIAAGTATDTTNTANIILGAFTKSTAGPWASGTGSNGMGAGLTVAPTTWYSVCLANNSGTPDVWLDTSAVCANRPSAITDVKYRRLGSFRTDASSHILAFTQTGKYFYWAAPTTDLATSSLTSGTDLTLTVPSGVSVIPLLGVTTAATATSGGLVNFQGLISIAGASTYQIPVIDLDAQASQSNSQQNNVISPPTNTSSQIRYTLIKGTGTASVLNFDITTQGWIDNLGQ